MLSTKTRLLIIKDLFKCTILKQQCQRLSSAVLVNSHVSVESNLTNKSKGSRQIFSHLPSASHNSFKSFSEHRRYRQPSISIQQDQGHDTPTPFRQEGQEKEMPFRRPRRDQSLNLEPILNLLETRGWEVSTNSEWESVDTELSAIFPRRWEVLCMKLFYTDNHLKLGRSLMTYLESRDESANRFVTTFYIGLLGKNATIEEWCDVEIKDYFDRFMAQTDLLDAFSIQVLVKGLANSSHYLDCLPLVEQAETARDGKNGLRLPVLYASLAKHNLALTRRILEDFEADGSVNYGHDVTNIAMVFDICMTNGNKEGLTMVTDFLQKHFTLFERENLDYLLQVFEKHEPGKWKATEGFIHHHWKSCNICHQQLGEATLSEEEYQKLRAAFMKQVIVEGNIYFKTTPQEVERFKGFIHENAPFDVVIDGLNVLYKNSGRATKFGWQKLEDMINYFTRQNKKVLVVGNNQMRYLQKACRNLEILPHLYMCSTTRVDDVFYLYAALKSSRTTWLVTSDMLRDHKYILDHSLKPIFVKWLKTVQLFDWSFLNKDKPIRPGNFKKGPVEDEYGWHFPINDYSDRLPFGQDAVLCLRKREFFKHFFKKVPYQPHQKVEEYMKLYNRIKSFEDGTFTVPSHSDELYKQDDSVSNKIHNDNNSFQKYPKSDKVYNPKKLFRDDSKLDRIYNENNSFQTFPKSNQVDNQKDSFRNDSESETIYNESKSFQKYPKSGKVYNRKNSFQNNPESDRTYNNSFQKYSKSDQLYNQKNNFSNNPKSFNRKKKFKVQHHGNKLGKVNLERLWEDDN